MTRLPLPIRPMMLPILSKRTSSNLSLRISSATRSPTSPIFESIEGIAQISSMNWIISSREALTLFCISCMDIYTPFSCQSRWSSSHVVAYRDHNDEAISNFKKTFCLLVSTPALQQTQCGAVYVAYGDYSTNEAEINVPQPCAL